MAACLGPNTGSKRRANTLRHVVSEREIIVRYRKRWLSSRLLGTRSVPPSACSAVPKRRLRKWTLLCRQVFIDESSGRSEVLAMRGRARKVVTNWGAQGFGLVQISASRLRWTARVARAKSLLVDGRSSPPHTRIRIRPEKRPSTPEFVPAQVGGPSDRKIICTLRHPEGTDSSPFGAFWRWSKRSASRWELSALF